MIVDAHLDLAYNALEHGRSLFSELNQIRDAELKAPCVDGIATVSFPEIRKGKIGLVFGTLFLVPQTYPVLNAEKMTYASADEAFSNAQAQLDYYHRIADESPSIELVGDHNALQTIIDGQDGERPLLGIVPLMEGADPIRHPDELEMWWERGLRVIGPAWDDTRYASGAWRGSRHGFTKDGYDLMEAMADLRFILDCTHLSEQATKEAIERYEGPLIATHSNSRSIAPHVEQRNLSDDQIRQIGERGGVIGIVLFNSFIKRGHRRGDRKALVTLEHVVAHVDHICQLLGSAEHVGIGSDMDGGLGWADIPAEMNSIADLHKIGDKLTEIGYDPDDVARIMGDNWVELLRRAWA